MSTITHLYKIFRVFPVVLLQFIIESSKLKRIAKLCGYNVGAVTATSRPPASEESMTP